MAGTSGPARPVQGACEARIRPYEPRFEDDVVEICWRTGLMGESLEGSGRFEDRRLFGLLFCLHYLRFEPETCLVALAPRDPGRPEAGDRAVGYVIGTTDTAAQRRDFDRRMVPRIAARLLLYDWWKHPESFRQTLAFARAGARAAEAHGPAGTARGGAAEGEALGGPEYPAHLHIDILPEWQGRGLGGRLMAAFLDLLRARGCPGLFLETSDRNLKALPFYRKLGFEAVGDPLAVEPGEFWLGLPARSVAMRLRLR